jgi:hypothetical protein
MGNRDALIKEIALAISKSQLREDEVTARLLSDENDRLTQRTALNRLNYFAEKGILVKRPSVGQMRENAYSPAEGYDWSMIIPMLGE